MGPLRGGAHLIKGNDTIGTVISGAGIHFSSGFEAVTFTSAIVSRKNPIISTVGECYIGEHIFCIWIQMQKILTLSLKTI